MSVNGYVNQYESMGNVDGPGTRFVIFLQGCNLRCKYCHNPETISLNDNESLLKSSDEVVYEVEKLKHFYKNGGVTISGGEPLLQLDFLIDITKKIKKLGLHIAIDTSGSAFNLNNKLFMNKFNTLLNYVDLLLVDIKHIDENKCIDLCGYTNANSLSLLNYLDSINKSVWIRYVLVPTITDDINDLIKTGEFIKKLNNVENVEILAYHDMALSKWLSNNMEYLLCGVPNATEDDVNKAYQLMFGNNDLVL